MCLKQIVLGHPDDRSIHFAETISVEIIIQLALIGAVACGLGAAYMVWAGQNAVRMSRRARFDTERQMAAVQRRRTTMTAIGLAAVAIVLLLINLIGDRQKR